MKIYLISIDLKKISGSSNIYFLAGDKRWRRQWLEVDSVHRDFLLYIAYSQVRLISAH